MTYVHVHVSEIPDPAGVVECTWATGVELARAALAGSSRQPPASAAEREALRASGGGSDTAGSTYEQLAVGLANRYGLHVAPTLALPATEIGDGTFLGVQGLSSHLSPWLRRWSPTFAGAHSVVIYKLGGVLRICDPLAPWDSTWHGEPISWSAVHDFHAELLGAKVISVKLPTVPETSTEVDMALGYAIVKRELGTVTVVGSGHSAIVLEKGTLVGLAAGTVKGYCARIRLNVPFGTGTNRQDGFLVGDQAACLLATDVLAAPDLPGTSHTITLQIDGVTSFTKAV